MRYGVPIRLEALLSQFVTRVQARSGLPTDLVFRSLAPDEAFTAVPPAKRFVVITPQSMVPVPSLFDGSGRYTMGVDGRFRVACIAEYSTDTEYRSTRELSDLTNGIIALFAKCIDALHQWDVPNGSGGSYVREPVRCEAFDIRPKRIERTNWAVLNASFMAKFVLDLESGVTPP
jgi:hypothetical protein